MRLLAIVPAFNEEASVAEVVKDIRRARPDADVLVVDDGSTDSTARAAREAGAKVLGLAYNMGIGAAMQAGYLYAAGNGYEAAVQVDADGQHDPAELGRVLSPIEQGSADLVVGSRFMETGVAGETGEAGEAGAGEGFRSTPMRRLGIRIFSRVLSAMTGEKVADPTSGFRAANARVIGLFAGEYPEDYPEVESILLCHLAGLRVAETPVTMRPRSGGRSSITPVRSVYYMVKVMLDLFVWLVRKKPVTEG